MVRFFLAGLATVGGVVLLFFVSFGDLHAGWQHVEHVFVARSHQFFGETAASHQAPQQVATLAPQTTPAAVTPSKPTAEMPANSVATLSPQPTAATPSQDDSEQAKTQAQAQAEREQQRSLQQEIQQLHAKLIAADSSMAALHYQAQRQQQQLALLRQQHTADESQLAQLKSQQAAAEAAAEKAKAEQRAAAQQLHQARKQQEAAEQAEQLAQQQQQQQESARERAERTAAEAEAEKAKAEQQAAARQLRQAKAQQEAAAHAEQLAQQQQQQQESALEAAERAAARHAASAGQTVAAQTKPMARSAETAEQPSSTQPVAIARRSSPPRPAAHVRQAYHRATPAPDRQHAEAARQQERVVAERQSDALSAVLARLHREVGSPPDQAANPQPAPRPAIATPNPPPITPSRERLGRARAAIERGHLQQAQQLLEEAQLQLVFRPVSPGGEQAPSGSKAASDVAQALSMLGTGHRDAALRYIDRAMAENGASPQQASLARPQYGQPYGASPQGWPPGDYRRY